jgi:hypothetical protein
MSDKLLDIHCFQFGKSNGGESFTLTTRFYGNGDRITSWDGVYTVQELTLNSYGNAATFNLCGTPITPDDLRELADQLEKSRENLTLFS